jgi:hypothetical protein
MKLPSKQVQKPSSPLQQQQNEFKKPTTTRNGSYVKNDIKNNIGTNGKNWSYLNNSEANFHLQEPEE